MRSVFLQHTFDPVLSVDDLAADIGLGRLDHICLQDSAVVLAKITATGYKSISDSGYEARLTVNAMAVTAQKMGRPPLKVKATTVRLSPETLERIDRLCGTSRRAEFIRAAVEEALKRARKPKPE